MKAGWEEKSLEDCLSRFPVPAKIPKKRFETKGRFPIMSQEAEFINGYWDIEADVCRIENPVVIFGDHTQVVKYVDFDFVVGADGVKVLNPKRFLDPKYLFYFVLTHKIPSLGYARHYRHIKEQPVSYPPLEEQKRIVAVLDEAFEGLSRARANAEANLQNARELFESVINSEFSDHGWEELELKDLAHEDCSLSYGIVQPGDEVEGGLPIVRPTDLKRKVITLDGLKRIDPALAKSYSRTMLVGGDILVCVRGTTGTIALAAEELSGANVTRGIVPVRFNDTMDQRFGYFQFLSKHIQRQIAEGTYGAALMQINIRDMKKLKFFCPSRQEQAATVERVEAFVESHELLLPACLDQLTDLDDLRQSLLQKAFAGELT